ncbi:acyltransferase family protein [Sphingomicrobium sediminis]|uniref:Acyltransferase n=1 Tax=Sphingomicrobium sediminis TaxID=2950949 RepID=A0A9X2EML1_9SPHN|nr:acyltransferase [Sphingomicrobium sediminis]MCM8558164.1 acyltransferase [Sphingomicrobium sediminis]
MAEENGPTKAGFITHLHAFRGVAIILIVGAHAPTMTIWDLGMQGPLDPNLALAAGVEVIGHNSTLFFAFISGLLFSTILAGRGWGRFYKSKILNVLFPYAFFTLLFTLFHWKFGQSLQVFSGDVGAYAREVWDNLLTGQASFQFWYIPVLAILFVLTPITAWTMRQRWAPFILVPLLAAPLVLSRTFPDNSVENVVVFLAPYAFGVWLGLDYEKRVRHVERLFWPCVVLAIVASIAAYILFFNHYGPLLVRDEDPAGPVNWYETASYVQKMALLCLVLLWLRAHSDWLPRWLDLLAINAFAIYFMHAFLLFSFFEWVNLFLDAQPPATVQIAVGLLAWIGVLAVSLAISEGLRRLLGPRSKMLIGA